MELTHPYALLGLILLIPVIIEWWRGLKFKIYSSNNHPTQQRIVNGLLFILRATLVSSLILLIASPYTLRSVENPLKNGIDIMIVLDLSKSMLAEDIIPSRIESARSTLQAFVNNRTEDRVGLIGFAGKPFTLSPLSFDTQALSDIVSRTGVDSIKQELPGLSGTALGDALLLGSEEFGDDLGRTRVMLVISDGEANVGIPPRDTLSILEQKKIKVHTIGIGDPRGIELAVTNARGEKQYFLDANGRRIIASIDEPLLRQLAQVTGGTYQNTKTAESLSSVIVALSNGEKKGLRAPPDVQKQDLTLIVAGAVCLLLMLLLYVEQHSPTSALRIVVLRAHGYAPESYNYKISPILYKGMIFGMLVGAGILGYATWILSHTQQINRGETLSLIVDLSRSMLVEDVQNEASIPVSRLSLAQSQIEQIINQAPRDQSISLTGFGGVAQVLVPATLNREALQAGVRALQAGSIPGGSNLESLSQALSSDSPTQALLFTDGALSDTDESLTTKSPPASSKIAKNNLSIILIGTSKGGPIPIASGLLGGSGYITKNGAPVLSVAGDEALKIYFPKASIIPITKMNESLLRDLKIQSLNGIASNSQLPILWIIASTLVILGLSIPVKTLSIPHA